METERIALSQKERNRLQVLRDVERGRLKQLEAEERMRVSDRLAGTTAKRKTKIKSKYHVPILSLGSSVSKRLS